MSKRILGDRQLEAILVAAAADQAHAPSTPVVASNQKRDARVKRAAGWCLSHFDPVRIAKSLEKNGFTIEKMIETLEEIVANPDTPASARVTALREARKLTELAALGDPETFAKVTGPATPPEPVEELPDPYLNRHSRLKVAAEG